MPVYRRFYDKKTKKYSYRPVKNIWWKRSYNKSYRMAKKALSLINVEFKKVDATGNVNVTSGSGQLILLNGLTKGDDYDNRDGRRIRMKSVELSLISLINASATDTVVKWFIVLDKQPNVSAPVLGDIFDSGLHAIRNLDNRSRFLILKKGVHNLNSNYPEKSTKCYRRLDIRTTYDASNVGDITDITTNSLYLVLASDEATNTPNVKYYSRIRFIDN